MAEGLQVESVLAPLVLSQVVDSPARAAQFLARSGDALRRLGRANVFCRLLLGRQLLVIQQRQLWAQMRQNVDAEADAGAGFRSWEDFMERGFPRITGLSKETGYAAVMLAKSDVLSKLPESELRKFEHLGNAILLVQLLDEVPRSHRS